MNIIFWLIILLMSAAAASFVLIPLWQAINRKTLAALAFMLVFLSLGFYGYWGDSAGVSEYWKLQRQAETVKKILAHIKNPQQIIDSLRAHLQQHPNSAKGWYLLGKLYFSLQQYHDAQDALARAYQLKPNDSRILTAFAEAYFMQYHHLNNKLQIQLAQLARQSSDPAALTILAMNAYLEKDYASAIFYWKNLLPQVSQGSQDFEAINIMIKRAQRNLHLGISGNRPNPPSNSFVSI